MTQDLLGIGELARSSGLTVSALRFYDREGVLAPAAVDPATGYRRYAVAQVRPARLVAGMRRIGVPLADIAVAVDHLQGGDGGRGVTSRPCAGSSPTISPGWRTGWRTRGGRSPG